MSAIHDVEGLMDGAVAGMSGAWNEILGAPGSAPIPVDPARSGLASRAIVRQAQLERAPAPAVRVVALDEAVVDDGEDVLVGVIDVLGDGITIGWDEILGAKPADRPSDDPFEGQRSRSAFPITQRLYQQFKSEGRPVRVEPEASYAAFRGQPIDAATVAEMLATHASDGHGVPIPLSLPPYAQGNVDCWREGDVICCSLRLPGPDGEPRIATATASAAEAEEEVLGYVERAGVNPIDILGVYDVLVGMLGGGRLVPEIATAAPAILARPEVASGDVFVGKMVRMTNPSKSAILALRQLVNAGNPQATAEWRALEAVGKDGELGEVMKRAEATLARAYS